MSSVQREGIGRLGVTVAEDPFPLGIDISRDQIVFSLERVPALDEFVDITLEQ